MSRGQCHARPYELTSSMIPRKNITGDLFVPFIDSLLQQLNDRFQGKAKDGIKGMFLIPSNLENIDAEKISIENFYSNDLPNQGEFDQEINLWKRYWLSENSITIKSLTETLDHIIRKNIRQMFPNITTIILLTT